jgi:hypothetical protein
MITEQERELYQQAVLEWYRKMLACLDSLPPDERAAFEQWDKARPIGVVTSDWPGFDKYLPPRPWSRRWIN